MAEACGVYQFFMAYALPQETKYWVWIGSDDDKPLGRQNVNGNDALEKPLGLKMS